MIDKHGNTISDGDRFIYHGTCEKATLRNVSGEGLVVFWDDGEVTWASLFYDERETPKELEKI